MTQFVPPSKILTLGNTRLSLPDIENLFRWLPSLNHLTIVDPVLIQDVKALDHTRRAVVLFSLTTLTVTCRADSWPAATFALFLTKLLSMFQSLESCEACLGGEPVLPARVQVSESTSPFLNIRKMTLTTHAAVLRHIIQTVPGTFDLPELHEHFRNPPDDKTLRHWTNLRLNRYYMHLQRSPERVSLSTAMPTPTSLQRERIVHRPAILISHLCGMVVPPGLVATNLT